MNGINNPCPSGYRLPTEAEWEAERQSWSENHNAAGAFDSPLKLPLAGSRYYENGLIFNNGNIADYWSSSVDGDYSRSLSFEVTSGVLMFYSAPRAAGYSVRCIKD